MTPDLIKICGLSTPQAIDAVIDGGATHLGLIFFEKSPRNVSLAKARELSAHAGSRISKVAVTVNATDAELDAIVEHMQPDLLQLHGRETPERVATVKTRYQLPVIKALAVSTAQDLEAARAHIGIADHFLFDAKAPKGAELPGGNGVAFDWEIMDLWPRDVPYILSGGLNIDNVADALLKTGASGIDISSGVESSPGQKDENLIRRFLQIVMKEDERVE